MSFQLEASGSAKAPPPERPEPPASGPPPHARLGLGGAAGAGFLTGGAHCTPGVRDGLAQSFRYHVFSTGGHDTQNTGQSALGLSGELCASTTGSGTRGEEAGSWPVAGHSERASAASLRSRGRTGEAREVPADGTEASARSPGCRRPHA